MRKIITLLLLFIIVKQNGFSQVVNERYINFRELAAYEAQHPEAFKACATCEKKEADKWSGINNPNMPFPPGATLKTPAQINQPIVMMAPSRAPAQNFLA